MDNERLRKIVDKVVNEVVRNKKGNGSISRLYELRMRQSSGESSSRSQKQSQKARDYAFKMMFNNLKEDNISSNCTTKDNNSSSGLSSSGNSTDTGIGNGNNLTHPPSMSEAANASSGNHVSSSGGSDSGESSLNNGVEADHHRHHEISVVGHGSSKKAGSSHDHDEKLPAGITVPIPVYDDHHPEEDVDTGEEDKRPFPIRLMELLDRDDRESAIAWLPCGTGFEILNPTKFVAYTLPRYFKQAKLASFIRRLNRWGFRQIPKAKYNSNYSAFRHIQFRRNEPGLCMSMKCASSRGRATALHIRSDSTMSDDMMNSPIRSTSSNYLPRHEFPKEQKNPLNSAVESIEQQLLRNINRVDLLNRHDVSSSSALSNAIRVNAPNIVPPIPGNNQTSSLSNIDCILKELATRECNSGSNVLNNPSNTLDTLLMRMIGTDPNGGSAVNANNLAALQFQLNQKLNSSFESTRSNNVYGSFLDGGFDRMNQWRQTRCDPSTQAHVNQPNKQDDLSQYVRNLTSSSSFQIPSHPDSNSMKKSEQQMFPLGHDIVTSTNRIPNHSSQFPSLMRSNVDNRSTTMPFQANPSISVGGSLQSRLASVVDRVKGTHHDKRHSSTDVNQSSQRREYGQQGR